MNEKQILDLMKTLDLSREEAIELIAEDREVDRMDMKTVDEDLTDEQKKAIKKLKSGAKAVDAYGKTRKVERKADTDKRHLVQILQSAFENDNACADITVTNIERQIDFKFKNRRFRVILSAPRK